MKWFNLFQARLTFLEMLGVWYGLSSTSANEVAYPIVMEAFQCEYWISPSEIQKKLAFVVVSNK